MHDIVTPEGELGGAALAGDLRVTIDQLLNEITTGRQTFSMDRQLFDLFNSLLKEHGYELVRLGAPRDTLTVEIRKRH